MKKLKNLNPEDIIWYDIETAPLVKELDINSPLGDSWAYKKQRDNLDDVELVKSYFKESALFPEFSKVVSICAGVIRGDSMKIKIYDHDSELDLLNAFNDDINKMANNKTLFGGFVIDGFDTPYCYKRMLINGIEPHDRFDTFDSKPWIMDSVDLAMLWKSSSFNRASLINVAVALGIESPKSDISGADVGRVYYEGGIDRISHYCSRDVLTTANIFRRLRGEDLLGLEIISVIEKLKITTDGNLGAWKNPSAKLIVKPFVEKIPEISVKGIVTYLHEGGKYTEEIKNRLKSIVEIMDPKDKKMAIEILNAIPTKAKGRVTDITKKDIKELI